MVTMPKFSMNNFTGTIILTNMCNLKCSYCYVKKSKNVINKKHIDNFINGMKYNNMIKYISFFGGEPTLLQNMILDIANENPDFYFGITTNGTVELNKYTKWPENIINITFSVEVNSECFKIYRGGTDEDYLSIFKNIDIIRKKLPKAHINLNISLSKYIIDNVDILNEFYNKYSKDYPILLYTIKGNHDYNKYDLYEFMLKLKNTNYKLYEDLLFLNTDNIDNFEYCCTYDDSLTLNYDGRLITCEKEEAFICNVDDYDSWSDVIAYHIMNLRDNFDKCKECIVPYNFCKISCAYDIKNNNIPKENCECEQLLYMLRMSERGEV